MCAKLLQSCPTPRDLMDSSPPGSFVHGILQARILEWVAMPSSGDLPDPGIEPVSLRSSALAGGFITTSAATKRPFSSCKLEIVRILTAERDEMVQYYSLQYCCYYQKKGKNLNAHQQGLHTSFLTQKCHELLCSHKNEGGLASLCGLKWKELRYMLSKR